jgi:5-methylcytosine-specific restriction endonuclease McrA
MAREFSADTPGVCDLSINFLRRKLQLSKKKVLQILDACNESGRILVEKRTDDFGCERVVLYCPKLKTLCDSHTSKILKKQNYNYNGGTRNWLSLKKEIRKRDKFCCRICGKTTEENKRSLQVHHINPFKNFQNPDDANTPQNLVSLCNSCHNQARTQKLDKQIREIQNELSQISSTKSTTTEEEVRSKKKEEDNKKPKPEPFRLPTREEIENYTLPKIKTKTEDVCKELYERELFTKANTFVNKARKGKANARAILHTLVRVFNARPSQPWGYALRILKVEDGNFCERDYRKTT